MAEYANPNVFQYLGKNLNTSIQSLTDLPSKNGGVLQFPPGLGGSASSVTIPFTLFMPYKRATGATGTGGFYSTKQNDDLYTSLPQPDFAIALPTPSSALKTNYAAEYGSFEVGQALGTVGGTLGTAVESVKSGKALPALEAVAQGAASVGKQAGIAAIAAGLEAAGGSAEIMNVATGQANNPYTENVFKNVRFREHDFSYTFSPRNRSESETIDKIIQLFKFAMLPRPGTGAIAGATGFFDFPYEFQITHSIQSTTFTLLPSVLESFDVDYSGGADTPKLFNVTDRGQYPVKISISMKFKEMVLLTRNRILQEADSTNQTKLSDSDYGDTLRFRF